MMSLFGNRLQLALWVMMFSFNLYMGTLAVGWVESFVRSVLVIGCHMVNFYGFYSLLIPRYFEEKKYQQTFFGSVGLIALLMPIRLVIEGNFDIASNFAINKFGFGGRVFFVLLTELTIAGFATLLRLANANERATNRLSTLSKMQIESELRFLKSQMNPHFLFNTINNIYSLTLLKSDNAPEALMKLSGLLRYLLYESNDKVSLKKEVQALHDYAELFQLRYETPLQLSMVINVRQDRLIEPHVLIPVLENALKHSGIGASKTSYVRLNLYEQDENMVLDCMNSKSNLTQSLGPGGIGLANIRKRLDMAYGDLYTLDISDTKEIYRLTLKIAYT
jgi:sensor histidine kinase YesM